MKMIIARAADVLLGGGVIAYPTEGVFGLGCMPDDADALRRLLTIKQRDPAKGLILIASSAEQLQGWIDPDCGAIPRAESSSPITWIAPSGPLASQLVRGANDGLAVRLTSNPIAAAICNAVWSPIVSTSANVTGRPAARNQFVLRRNFAACVDYIVPGDCGPSTGPSEIRNLVTGMVLRPRMA
jgi:L-threonylcarbamoyladenylate synthase